LAHVDDNNEATVTAVFHNSWRSEQTSRKQRAPAIGKRLVLKESNYGKAPSFSDRTRESAIALKNVDLKKEERRFQNIVDAAAPSRNASARPDNRSCDE